MSVRARFAPALAVACCLAVAACAGSSGTGATSSGGATTRIVVGTSPTISNASLYLAAQDGTFTKNGLAESATVVQSGQQAIPRLLNGELQFAAADPLGAIVAISQGAPLEIVATGPVVPSTAATDPSAIIVKQGSSIHSLADLAGKTVGVNALKSLAQVGAEAAIDDTGGHSGAARWVEIGFPQMIAAVRNGTVDAAASTEPFVTQAKADGMTVIPSGGLSTAMSGVPQLVYLASTSYIASHAAVVKAFVNSIDAANAKLGTDPSEIRTIGATSTTINAATLAKIILPDFGPSLSTTTLTKLEGLMVRYGVLSTPLRNLSQYVYAG
jgi:NitT/TauT family transport system substrate-binding protein